MRKPCFSIFFLQLTEKIVLIYSYAAAIYADCMMVMVFPVISQPVAVFAAVKHAFIQYLQAGEFLQGPIYVRYRYWAAACGPAAKPPQHSGVCRGY